VSLAPLTDLPAHGSLISVPISGGELAVVDVQPPSTVGTVHLIHGFNGSKEDFWDMIPFLVAGGYRVVAHDHRGINQSSHHPSYSLSDLVDDVRAVQDALDLRNVHVLGHSFGGLVAQLFSLAHPVASLTLLCSGPGAPASAREWLPKFAGYLKDHSAAEAYQDLVASPRTEINLTPNPDRTSLAARRWLNGDTRALVAQAEMLTDAIDVTKSLSQTEFAKHIIYGQFDDAWPIEQQDSMAAQLGAVLSVVAEAGHCPNEDAPVDTSELLMAFWRQHG